MRVKGATENSEWLKRQDLLRSSRPHKRNVEGEKLEVRTRNNKADLTTELKCSFETGSETIYDKRTALPRTNMQGSQLQTEKESINRRGVGICGSVRLIFLKGAHHSCVWAISLPRGE